MALTKTHSRLIEGSEINVFDYMTPAQITSVKAEDLTEDVTSAIQAALDAGEKNTVRFPAGRYKITSPLYVYQYCRIVGQGTGDSGSHVTNIHKTTSTVGTGSETSGGITDTYNVNAIVIMSKRGSSYNRWSSIENIRLSGATNTVDYGIYCPRGNGLELERVAVYGCRVGFYTVDSWMCSFDHAFFDQPATTLGTSYGIQWDGGSGGGSGTGTSLAASNVYCKGFEYGMWLNGLSYSSIVSSGCDNCTKEAYHCEGSVISFIGCGFEALDMGVGAVGGIYLTNGWYQLQNCVSYNITVTTGGSTACAIIWVYSSRVTIDNCKFPDYDTITSGAPRNYHFQESDVVVSDTQFPTNGTGTSRPALNGNATIQYGTPSPSEIYNLNGDTLELVARQSVLGIELYNATAPSSSVTNGICLYSEDVTSSAELKVRDEAGNITTLSPHNFDLIPDGASEDMAFSYYSEKDGSKINVDMLKALRVLERLSGEQIVYIEKE